MITTESSTLSPALDGRRLVAVAATVGVIGCAGYISTIVLLADLTTREAVRSPLSIVSNLLVAGGFAVLAAALPLFGLRAGLPRWASVLAGVGCAAVAATSWGTGTLAVFAAGLLSDEQMEVGGAWLLVFQAPQSLPCAVAFTALGAAVLRYRIAARGAGVLLVVAGVISIVPAYPPGAFLASLGLLWLASSLKVESAVAR